MDLFVVPTLGFDLLYAFVIVRIDRSDLVWINVTPHPTAKMGCTPNHRSIHVERSFALHDPRPGPDLWCACHPPIARHGHAGQAHSTRSGVSAWTTSLSWARCICVKSCDPMRTELINLWTR